MTVNLLSGLTDPEDGEVFSDLLRWRNLRIERIISGALPDNRLYDQEQDEWVVLLEGRAVLEVSGTKIRLSPGDNLFIPAHTPHRVLETYPEPCCVWLAVHLYPEGVDA